MRSRCCLTCPVRIRHDNDAHVAHEKNYSRYITSHFLMIRQQIALRADPSQRSKSCLVSQYRKVGLADISISLLLWTFLLIVIVIFLFPISLPWLCLRLCVTLCFFFFLPTLPFIPSLIPSSCLPPSTPEETPAGEDVWPHAGCRPRQRKPVRFLPTRSIVPSSSPSALTVLTFLLLSNRPTGLHNGLWWWAVTDCGIRH